MMFIIKSKFQENSLSNLGSFWINQKRLPAEILPYEYIKSYCTV
ncbi:hypothetical protein [Paenibacillus glacialis]|nr:hypothetical protein [Paenibacillus glacialis]